MRAAKPQLSETSRRAAARTDQQRLEGLANLAMVAGDIEVSIAEVLEAVVEVTGATAAALLPGRDGEGDEWWHGVDEASRRGLRDLVRAVPPSAGVRTVVLEASTLRVSPLGSEQPPLGVVALLFSGACEEAPVVEAAERLLSLSLERVDRSRRLASTRAELKQVKRWFDTMDAQMRILDRERQKFAAVVNQSDTPMFVVDEDHLIRWTNNALKAALGATRGEGLPVQRIWDLLEVRCAPSRAPGCPISRAFHDNLVVHEESKVELAGAAHHLYLSFLPIKGLDGRTAEILVMIQDLSQLAVVRRSEARYRSLFERSPNAIIMVAPQRDDILLANLVASRLTGYSTQELSSLSLEALYDPEDWPSVRGAFAAVLVEDSLLCAEQRLVTRSGASIVANVSAARFDLDGQPVMLLELQDVTEQRRLETELRHSQKMEAVGRLAGGVAHEFNNIMTIILAQAELLGAYPDLDETLQEISDNTEKAALRAAHLTRKLLAFSRKEAVRAESLDLNRVVSSVEGLLRFLLGKRVALHLSLHDEPCPVLADRWELEQVLLNLTANARDALPRGGNFWLETSLSGPTVQGAPAQATLRARDDGVGMDPLTRSRLFEPFFTTKAPGEGTGIGMSTVYRIVERCGGTIDVESELDLGTTFVVSLPLGEAVEGASTPAPRRSCPARGEERVLVVDDEPQVRRSVARLLGLDSYQVTLASSGEEALTLCDSATAPFHLLLTDVVMPGMSGGELAGLLQERFPELRVLFMSGYNDAEILDHGASRPETSLIRKPFTRQALSQKIRDVLDL